MKTPKELADIGAAAAFSDNKRYHYMSVSKQSHSWRPDEPARQAFAQAVKDAVMEDLVTNQISSPSKPWALPPPPSGRQWHRDDWTEEMLPKGYRPLLLEEKDEIGDEMFQHRQWVTVTNPAVHSTAEDWWVLHRTRRPLPTPDPYAALKEAHAAGKVIQFKPHGCPWIDFEETDSEDSPDWTAPPYCYRIKPEPVLVPLDMDDIRATDEFKHMESHIVETADHWNCQEVTLSWSGAPSYDVLAAFYLRRQHGSNEWKPCTKETQQ